jgi:hypothetical protein
MNTKSFSARSHLSAGSALKVCPFEPKSRCPLNATTLRLTDRARRADTRYPTTG